MTLHTIFCHARSVSSCGKGNEYADGAGPKKSLNDAIAVGRTFLRNWNILVALERLDFLKKQPKLRAVLYSHIQHSFL